MGCPFFFGRSGGNTTRKDLFHEIEQAAAWSKNQPENKRTPAASAIVWPHAQQNGPSGGAEAAPKEVYSQ
jgi:hypothetical protein